MTDKQFIFDFCKNPTLKTLTNREIAKKLVKLKKFKEWDNPYKFDSLRRRVAEIRNFYGLKDKPDMSNFYKDIETMRKKYPEATHMSIASKLHLKYSHLKVISIREYIRNFTNYGIKNI